MSDIILYKNGKWTVNGKKVYGYRYKSPKDGNIYQVNSDGTRTILAGRRKEKDGNWHLYGSDGTRTLIGKNKYNLSGIKTTSDRPYNPVNLSAITQSLENFPVKQRASIVGDIAEESGGNPLSKSKNGTYQGLLQWGADRYRITSNDSKKELNTQMNYLKSSVQDITDTNSWTHGGVGSGYNSKQDSFGTFNNPNSSLRQVHHAFDWGYVRPKDKQESTDNRFKVVQQVYPKIINATDSIQLGLLPPFKKW